MAKSDITKDIVGTLKETFGEFLSIKENGTLQRNIIGSLLVMLPEVPAYFIPAYSEAKATGNAENIKKGEGARGLLTGALEGLAVGAIVSTAKDDTAEGKLVTLANAVKAKSKDPSLLGDLQEAIKGVDVAKIAKEAKDTAKKTSELSVKRILPFVIVGACLQFVSSKVFPIVGEKLGQSIYYKNKAKMGASNKDLANVSSPQINKVPQVVKFKGLAAYDNTRSGLKI